MNPSITHHSTHTMKTHITIGLTSILLTSFSLAGEAVVEQNVVIPFSEPGGVINKPASMSFTLPRGSYKITLRVARAKWDRNVDSLAQHVPIGLGAYCVTRDLREVNKQPWKTANGVVSTQISVPDGAVLQVVFSTIAPHGAKGLLTIENLNPKPSAASNAASSARRQPAGMR